MEMILNSSMSEKSLDVKIYELRENPSDVDLLVDVLAYLIYTIDMMIEEDNMKPIKDIDLVNYVLASALKIDQVPPKHLGLVMAYIDKVNAPSLYFQYAILRVHQHISEVRLYDIAQTVNNCQHLIDDSKVNKLLARV